jgi:hypothetical protein
LDNEVDLGHIQTSCCNICCEEDGRSDCFYVVGEVLLSDIGWVFPVKRDQRELVRK